MQQDSCVSGAGPFALDSAVLKQVVSWLPRPVLLSGVVNVHVDSAVSSVDSFTHTASFKKLTWPLQLQARTRTDLQLRKTKHMNRSRHQSSNLPTNDT